jgi:hypothetical protein
MKYSKIFSSECLTTKSRVQSNHDALIKSTKGISLLNSNYMALTTRIAHKNKKKNNHNHRIRTLKTARMYNRNFMYG